MFKKKRKCPVCKSTMKRGVLRKVGATLESPYWRCSNGNCMKIVWDK